ncbi:P-loop containing nucleoside triphosphate hydrolase protein, partial [Geopyxis carbonaria]
KKGPVVPEVPRGPSVQEIIGGKSWTGKLPQNLFYEHCVRAGWEKPSYDMRREPAGFVATVHIGLKNAKTRELERVSFRAPSAQPSALEARHYCATYALHRVSNMKNVHMLLPPTHRDFWAGFEETRKEEVAAGKAWRYEADPFVVKREHEAAVAKRAAEEEKRGAGAGAGGGGGGGGRERDNWARNPVVDMSERRRNEVEALIRKYHVWAPTEHSELPKGVRDGIVREMVALGFRAAHAEEATEWATSAEGALEWLLIHVPEDDVPARFLPENYAAGISMGPNGIELGVEYAARRLSAAGYALDVCREVLAQNDNDEGRAAEALMQKLCYGEQTSPMGKLAVKAPQDTVESDEMWDEEQQSLAAIYGPERFSRPDKRTSRVVLEVHHQEKKKVLPQVTLEIRQPSAYEGCAQYPHALPTIAIIPSGAPKLPAYVRLSIIRHAAEYADALKGDQMVFALVDWLENEIVRIATTPGKLRDLASAITGADERERGPKKPAKPNGRRAHKRLPIDWTPGTPKSMQLLKAAEERQRRPEQVKMLKARQALPAWQLRDDIVAAVNAAQVTIISGETGSGKSTQAVQFMLDDLTARRLGGAANIVCTQPRRISAIGLAERVSDERCQAVGQEVGYAIRGESRQTHGVTRVCFVTTGVLLRRLQTGDGLEDVSHIVIDEVHERSLDTDFLLILVKRMIAKRKDLKIVLMSATLDAEVFAEYFGGAEKVRMVHIEGRTFPVTDVYLDELIKTSGGRGKEGEKEREREEKEYAGIDPSVGAIIRGLGDRINYPLIASTVMHIDSKLGDKEGAILIFLPGTMEIQHAITAITATPRRSRFTVLPLHASLPPSSQRLVFPPASQGMRKIICATNVAETSITIPDVVCVIDTGKVKETAYDAQHNVVRLEEVWASRAACQQRRGRAGRVQAGTCYKLYTKSLETSRMPARPQPELQRVPLAQTCLAVKALGVSDAQSFLAAALSPPSPVAVSGALLTLTQMGALTSPSATGTLTPLGTHMSLIPADLRCAKLLVYGALFSLLHPCLTIAALLTARSPFVAPQQKRTEANAARAAFARGAGDLLADCRAFDAWAALKAKGTPGRELRAWCDENFLSSYTLQDIAANRHQYLSSLRDLGFLPHGRTPHPDAADAADQTDSPLLPALIAGAFSPQLARIQFPSQKFTASAQGALALDPDARSIKYFTAENGRVFVHPSSTLFSAQAYAGGVGWVVFWGKMATASRGGGGGGKVFLRDLTPVTAWALLLFGGEVEVDVNGRGLTVGGWLRLRGWGRIGVLVKGVRRLVDGVLERMVEEPGMAAGGMEGREREVVAAVEALVAGNGI